MAKVISTHHVELKPGVSSEEFERYLGQMPKIELPGLKAYYAKGDRGERAGKYAFIIEFDSVEQRDAIFPVEGQPLPTEEVRQAIQSFMDHLERGSSLTAEGPDVYTDYVAVWNGR